MKDIAIHVCTKEQEKNIVGGVKTVFGGNVIGSQASSAFVEDCSWLARLYLNPR